MTAPIPPASSTRSSTSGSSRMASGTDSSKSKAELIAAIDKKLSAFPGDQLQLHAAGGGRGGRSGDGAQELARRQAVRHRPQRARGAGQGDQDGARRRARHHARDARAGAGAAEPHHRRRPQQDRALRHQRRRRERADRGGGGRIRGHAGRAGRADLRSRRASQAGVSRDAGADRQHPRRHAGRARRSRCASWRRSRVSTGASFIYRQDNSRYIGVQYSVEGRDLAGAVQDAQRQVAARCKLPTGYRVVWGGEYEEYTASRGQLRIVVPGHAGAHLPAALHAVSELQVPGDHGGRRASLRAAWRRARTLADGDAILRVVGDRLSRAVRRVGADGGGVHLVRQRAAPAGTQHCRCDARGRAAPPSARFS